MKNDVHSIEEGVVVAARIGYPVKVKPFYTLAGAGTAVAQHAEELRRVLQAALDLSPLSKARIVRHA